MTGKKAISFLSAEWWNARVERTLDRLELLLLDRALGKTLESGYLPLEQPVTGDDLRRMTPDQLANYIGTLPSIEEKVGALEKLGRVPPSVLPTPREVKRTPFAT